MDEDTAELASRLCTRIGMIMEDASVVALTIGSLDEADRPDAIARLENDARCIDQLIGAVHALASWNDPTVASC
ncbi:MAG: hypothetical protein H6917_00915 [Novosphingobium sp.]|nr:hypothetical protein [Novosphingobium sp.]MCP5400930.1 hypothetical protein [Novosphingobium sp.]